MHTLRLTLTFSIDEQTLAAVHAGSFPRPWNADDFGALLTINGTFSVLAWVDERPTGLLMLRVAAEEVEVLTLCVDIPHRRIGIAQAMLEKGLIEAMRLGAAQAFLEVAESNGAARNLYTNCGFTEIGRRPNYYANGDDAVVMRRELP